MLALIMRVGEKLKDWLALTIDLFVSLIVLGLTHMALKNTMPRHTPLVFFLAGALAGFLFFKWNRGLSSGSIGERLIGHT